MSQPAQISTSRDGEAWPPRLRVWKAVEPDAFAQAEAEYKKWLTWLDQMEEMFRRFVYDNPEAGQLDYRLHRQHLHAALAWGESVAIDFAVQEEDAETAKQVAVIDQKLAVLNEVLNQWHGASTEGIPESFLRAMEGVRRVEGLVEMETALHQPPPR